MPVMDVPNTSGASPAPRDPLAEAIWKQEEVLKSMQATHNEFHPSVSDDLAQLALLHSMRGDHAKALPLLHKRLVIHEKHGPAARIGEALHELGTTYCLLGMWDIALQHLERALATRQECYGATSFKVAETLNSIALLHQACNENEQADSVQKRSLHVLLGSAEPEDIESEDIPWEVYKRLKQQRGPSTAANSITLLAGTMRQCVEDSLNQSDATANDPLDDAGRESSELFFGAEVATPSRWSTASPSPSHAYAISGHFSKSKSDSAMAKLVNERDAQEDLEELLSSVQHSFDGDDHEVVVGTAPSTERSPSPVYHTGGEIHAKPDKYEPIRDAATLQSRVEHIKRRVVSGAVAMDMEIARFASDVDLIPSVELRRLGETMVELVREMYHMRIRVDRDVNQLPQLEGFLEKKSASIFRGWERRFFRVDAKTFILSYHYSKEDCDRGFAPRGGFSVARIINIVVHRSPIRAGSGISPGLRYDFDVVVDLSTRLKPHAERVYELRAETQNVMQHWVDMLQYYKARAQTATHNGYAIASPTARPGTS